MIPFAPYIIAGTAGLALISSGVAVFSRMELKVERQRVDVLEQSNKVLRADLDAIGAADSAVSARIEELNRTAAAATRALREARKADATLDACLSYDPGIDLTGGLRDALPD